MNIASRIPVLERNTEFQSDSNTSQTSSVSDQPQNQSEDKPSEELHSFRIFQLKQKLSVISLATSTLNTKFEQQCHRLEYQIHENSEFANSIEKNIKIYQKQLKEKMEHIKNLKCILKTKKKIKKLNYGSEPYTDRKTVKKSSISSKKNGTPNFKSHEILEPQSREKNHRKNTSVNKRNRSSGHSMKMRHSQPQGISRGVSQKKLRAFAF